MTGLPFEDQLYLGIVAAFGGAIVAVNGLLSNRRAEEDRVLSIVAESTSEPLATDRHCVGSVCARERELRGESVKYNRTLDLTDDEVVAFFRVLWYFQRVDALHRALPRFRYFRLRKLLIDSLSPMILSWNKDVSMFNFRGRGPGNKAGGIIRDNGPVRVNVSSSGRALSNLVRSVGDHEALDVSAWVEPPR